MNVHDPLRSSSISEERSGFFKFLAILLCLQAVKDTPTNLKLSKIIDITIELGLPECINRITLCHASQ